MKLPAVILLFLVLSYATSQEALECPSSVSRSTDGEACEPVLGRTFQESSSNPCSLPSYKSMSQLLQDNLVMRFFNCKREGFFIDIGSSDGLKYSNSYNLEQKLNWQGICIDPFPSNMSARACTLVRAAVSDKVGELVEIAQTENSMFSGLVPEMESHREKLATSNRFRIVTTTVTSVLRQLSEVSNVPAFIDFVSIDTEGSELNILQSFPFGKHKVGVFTIEHNNEEPKRSMIRELLIENGYTFAGGHHFDDIYYYQQPSHCEGEKLPVSIKLKEKEKEIAIQYCENYPQGNVLCVSLQSSAGEEFSSCSALKDVGNPVLLDISPMPSPERYAVYVWIVQSTSMEKVDGPIIAQSSRIEVDI